MIPLRLRARDGTTLPPIAALIDSGADGSLFPLDIARFVGIDLDVCEAVKGVTAGGPSDQLRSEQPVQADLLGKVLDLDGRFDSDLDVILLGRADFFTVFKVAFDERHRRVRLTPYD